MTVQNELTLRQALYINGEWSPSSSSDSIDVESASTEEVVGRVPMAGADDVARAVDAARAALADWSRTSTDERRDVLSAAAKSLGARSDEIARLIAGEVGTPLPVSRMIQAGLPQAVMGSYAGILDGYAFEEEVGTSLVWREPVGVVGCITPWNFPLHQIVAKVAPALAAGCAVVLKPSEVAPLNALVLAEILDGLGLPKGVFNVVTGIGPVAGEAIVTHPGVDMVSFTGSTRAGRRVSELAAATVKRVTLELGGKSANVILEDADLESAVADGVGKCYFNSGQSCIALSRMLVSRNRYADAVEIAKRTAEEDYPLTDPLEQADGLGPLISGPQRDRVRGYIEKGIAEGATLVTGGAGMPAGFGRGHYVEPTVFSDVSNDMTIAQEEIFGPVLSIIPYEDEDDAIRIANDSAYGLAGGVWSADTERAKRVARRIRTGMLEINGGQFNPVAPFGGVGQSGHGRELGVYGLEEFLEVKSLQL